LVNCGDDRRLLDRHSKYLMLVKKAKDSPKQGQSFTKGHDGHRRGLLSAALAKRESILEGGEGREEKKKKKKNRKKI